MADKYIPPINPRWSQLVWCVQKFGDGEVYQCPKCDEFLFLPNALKCDIPLLCTKCSGDVYIPNVVQQYMRRVLCIKKA